MAKAKRYVKGDAVTGSPMGTSFELDVVVIGGCGHVGLPLALALADRGARVGIYDVSQVAVDAVRAGQMPFAEPGAAEVLRRVKMAGRLKVSTEGAIVESAEHVIVVIGTPVDEHLNPDQGAIPTALDGCADQLRSGQILILRSTVYPRVTALVEKMVAGLGVEVDVAFCPERIAEGKAMTELFELPQIISARTQRAVERASRLFGLLTSKLVVMPPEEAELAKLFTNAWRYANFAISNQFYMLSQSRGLDFYRIHDAVTRDYPRMKSFARAGFAAGPCLLKDTLQLAAFSQNNFFLGHAAMLINEGLPMFLVEQLRPHGLANKRVAILGMAFKAESDDKRDSLSFKLKKLLEVEAQEVLCTDPYLHESYFVSLETAIRNADVVIIGAPHAVYRDVDIPEGKIVADPWNFVPARAMASTGA